VGAEGVGAGGAAAGAGVEVGAAAGPASSPDCCSSLGFLREAAVAEDFSRGRRGARVDF
jgi:hypothetical protein